MKPVKQQLALATYFTFLPAIEIAGFPALELAVAETFGFSCFGFFASLLLFLPLAMVCPSRMQRSDAVMAKRGCATHHASGVQRVMNSIVDLEAPLRVCARFIQRPLLTA